MPRGELILGTSGFSYNHWRDVFYPHGLPQSRWLEYYAEHFSAVELNVSFYRLPRAETFAEWARRTPEGFRFVVKGSRTITHYRRLHDAEAPLRSLFMASSALGDKLACMLWQLPPKLAPDAKVLDTFCELLLKVGGQILPGVNVRHAFEFRDPRWFDSGVLEVLRQHQMALVVADPPCENEPRELTADFAYLRFHHGKAADGGYRSGELEPYAHLAERWTGRGADVFVFFNNDPGGWAPRNAKEFATLTGLPATGVPLPISTLAQ